MDEITGIPCSGFYDLQQHTMEEETKKEINAWREYFKNSPLLQYCLKVLDAEDTKAQIYYHAKKESYWDKFGFSENSY